jgi:hypothetical protein
MLLLLSLCKFFFKFLSLDLLYGKKIMSLCLSNQEPCYEDVRWSGGIAPQFLTSVSGQLHGPSHLPKRKEPPRTHCYVRLGGSQNRTERYGEEKNPFPLPAIKPRFLGRPAHRLVSIPTELWINFQI